MTKYRFQVFRGVAQLNKITKELEVDVKVGSENLGKISAQIWLQAPSKKADFWLVHIRRKYSFNTQPPII
jgi:hypothetical protein